MNSKGELLYKNKDIADALNGYFVLANIEMGDKEILAKLQKLKTNKAAGPDGIFPRVP